MDGESWWLRAEGSLTSLGAFWGTAGPSAMPACRHIGQKGPQGQIRPLLKVGQKPLY
jgi:hypothetical protein